MFRQAASGFGRLRSRISAPLRLGGCCGASSACLSSATSARWPTGASVALPSPCRGHPWCTGSSQRMGTLTGFLSCRGGPPSSWAPLFQRLLSSGPSPFHFSCCGLMFPSSTGTLHPHDRPSGSRVGSPGGGGVEYLDAVKDTYQFTEEDHVEPSKRDLCFASPGFSKECSNGTQ